MAPNYWAVICDEVDAPGLWKVWWKEGCVAIGWSPQKHPVVGPAKSSSWAKARSRALKIKLGDIVIPYLKRYRFGVPGKVMKVSIGDDQWDPTLPKNKYGHYPSEARLGRRILLECPYP